MKIILTLNFAEDEGQSKTLTPNTTNNDENVKSGDESNKQTTEKPEKQLDDTNNENEEEVEESVINSYDHLKRFYGEDTDNVIKDAIDNRVNAINNINNEAKLSTLDKLTKKFGEDYKLGRITPAGAVVKLPIYTPWINKTLKSSPIELGFNAWDSMEMFKRNPDVERKVNNGEVLLSKTPYFRELAKYYFRTNEIKIDPQFVPIFHKVKPLVSRSLGLMDGYIDPKTNSFNYSPSEKDLINHEWSHALNTPIAAEELVGKKLEQGMYLVNPTEIWGSMGTFRRMAAQQGYLIKTPEDFKNVLNQIKIGKEGEGYWPNGERVDSETQRFLNTGRHLDWNHIKEIQEQDPNIWRKLVRSNNNYQQPRRSYTGLPQRTHYA